MIAVRFATLVALVLWVGAMASARFGDLFRRIDLVAYACAAVTIVGLFVMKFMGPPPAAFVPRTAIAVLMLLVAAASAWVAPFTASLLLSLNLALGFVLLMWYVRE